MAFPPGKAAETNPKFYTGWAGLNKLCRLAKSVAGDGNRRDRTESPGSRGIGKQSFVLGVKARCLALRQQLD